MVYRDGTTIGVFTKVEKDSNWKKVIGKRKLHSMIVVEYGFAEEVMAMMEFKDGTFEVGIGEALRPYELLYLGDNLEDATLLFMEAIQEHTWVEQS